jgi:hypothetical protein
MFKTLLGLFKGATPTERSSVQAPFAEAMEAFRAAARPGLSLIPAEEGRSWLGGAPTLTADFTWPRNEGRPLAFLGQIDLGEAGSAGGPDWLPRSGLLQFYYDLKGNVGGSTPSERPFWAVVHAEPVGGEELAAAPPDLPAKHRFSGYPVRLVRRAMLPPFERLEEGDPPFSPEQTDASDELLWDEAPQPDHRVGGFPRTIQNDDLELTCELIARGLPLPKTVHQASQAMALKPAAEARWRLLLQLDSDRRMRTNWTDGGLLYFFIPEEDARVGDFSRVWLQTQFF